MKTRQISIIIAYDVTQDFRQSRKHMTIRNDVCDCLF